MSEFGEVKNNVEGGDEAMEVDGISQQDGSDTTDDEDDDDEKEQQLRFRAAGIRKQLSENPLYYEGHVNLIATLRELFELEEARKAREIMSKEYPLSPELWLDWIRDEQKVCSNADERQYIIELFDRAAKDYTSVQVWVEYIMFMLGGGDTAATRAVIDRALTAVGTHVAEGILIWQVVLLVEKQIYAGLQKPGAVQTEESQKEIEKQQRKIQSLFRRQARIPLMNLDPQSLLEEASDYFDEEIDSQMKADLEKTQEKLEKKITFEEELLRAENDVAKLAVYRRYIAYTRKNDNPAVVQNLFERAVTDHCLDPALWEEYCKFVIRQFRGLDYVVLPVCERSQRNCPWSAGLCEMHITALQMFAVEGEEKLVATKIKESLERGLGCGLQSGSDATRMWMSYLIFLRRQILWDQSHELQLEAFREAGQQAIDMIDKNFDEVGDLESVIPRFLAKVEAEHVKNMEGAREIWNNVIMKRNNNYKNANFWLEFISLERSYGTEKHCRKLFRRALERVWDDVEVVGVAFQRFEEETGTLESMEDFEKRYDDRMVIVRRVREEEAAKLQKEDKNEKSVGYERKESHKIRRQEKWKQKKEQKSHLQDSSFKAPLPVKEESVRNTGFKGDVASPPGFKGDVAPPPGFKGDIAPPPGFKGDVAPPPGFKSDIAPPPGFKGDVAPPPGFKGEIAPPPGFKGDVAPPPGFKGDIASPPGFKGDVAPPPGFKGDIASPPGFKGDDVTAPPGFKDGDKSSKANKRRHDDISADMVQAKKQKVEEMYGVQTVQAHDDHLCTVFLSNLDFSAEKEDILPVVSQCGEIAEFRLVRDYKCRSKGYGYLVFKTHEAAVKCLELDRSPVKGRPVYISPYNPEGHQHHFKYSTGLEKEKLFIRNLPPSMKEDDIRKVFEVHGKVKSLRLITYRNGHSKGNCYIEYDDADTAEKVRQAMDGQEFEGKAITVLISDPSKKISQPNKSSAVFKEPVLGVGVKGKKLPGSRGQGMFNLMPRALLRTAPPPPQAASTSTSSDESKAKKLSNEDFRNMLLKK